MTNTQAPAELKPSEKKALAALAEHSGATAAEIARHAGIGGSTAGKALNTLESWNLAYREHGEKDGARKTPDRWYHRPVEATPAHISDEAENPAPAEPEAPATQAPAPADNAADSAPEATEATEPHAPAPEAATQADTTAPTKRLARGGLRQMVYEYLEAHPGEEVTPSRLAKHLQRSAGAVANALAKLKDHGQADLVGESPRRYRLAGQA
ncbi:MarR family transcriptional regulator [Streptomyces sp. NPDC014986]|uniref:MarR family transcriptional regulator n=1 Tax=Streptomyces sp. NPDC014986 TaxID=3364934 RepID=UPI0036F5D4D7